MAADVSLRLDRAALADAVRSSPQFRALTRRIEHQAVQNAQRVADSVVKRRTGDYVGNFETTVTPLHQTVNLVRLRLFNTKRHAIFIEEGTRPHRIPKTGRKLLVFEWRGQTVFRHFVHHPGTKAHHVIREALQRLVRSGV